LLYREVLFVTRAMLVLEKRYAQHGNAPPFFLVGHSMGGLVAAVASADPLMPHGMWPF
jgi:alpha-beta hydrolase superfamily lysophospholipase